jgi:hypothetical protein
MSLIANVTWPNRTEGSERVECDGIIAGSYHDLCRKLVATHPDQSVTFYRNGKPCYVIRSIREGAKWTVTENDKAGLRLRPYEPFKLPGIGQERRS